MPMETGAGAGAALHRCLREELRAGGEALYLFRFYNIQQIFMDPLSL